MIISGLFATRKFEKDDIIVDYDGTVITGMSMNEYLKTPGTIQEFVLEVPTGARRIIDATNDVGKHPTNYRLGRLANHVCSKKSNMRVVDLTLDKCDNHRVIVFKARKTIYPLEQLRWDYMDKNAQNMFTD